MAESGAIGRISAVVIDVHGLTACGQFWSEVLEVSILSEDERYLVLDRQPGGVGLILQKVPEEKVNKNRVHIDLSVKDVDAALSRAEALGAHKVRVVLDPDERFIVLTDPDGNEFCLVEEEG